VTTCMPDTAYSSHKQALTALCCCCCCCSFN
jgi:hypothetical protein